MGKARPDSPSERKRAAQIARIRDMLASGMDRGQIASALGMTRNAANRWLRVNNLKPRPADDQGVKWTPDVVAEVRRLKLTNTWAEVGAMYGVTGPTVKNAILRSEFKPANTMQHRDKSAPQKPRLCLCGCGQRFGSTHPGERIRPECRPAWEARL